MTEHNLRVALEWTEVGASIFVTGPDKKPRMKWRDQSTSNPRTIKDWFNRWPDSLPAIDLAKSGIVVIDGDRHGGPDGVAAAEQMFAQHKLTTAAIPTVITPQDGRHYWFRQPTDSEPLGNGDKSVRDRGINVRGHGGYVIAPEARCLMGDNTKATEILQVRLKQCATALCPFCLPQSRYCFGQTGTTSTDMRTETRTGTMKSLLTLLIALAN